MSDSVIEFNGVSKRFRLGATHDSLRDLAAAALGSIFGGKKRNSADENFWAIKDVDFCVRRGEVLGIIGPNGAGKSTALKLLAGILRPDGGVVRVTGRLAALIEVGAGFHGDLTGRENIFLNGTILGMKRREIASKLDAIVEFAGLEKFLDMPVKRYSSGMYARLGFSIAAHVEPDVLLIDEVLSVGDAVFRLRCIERMKELVQSGTTLVFVTHDLDQMQKVCTRTIVLDHGEIAFEGSPADAVDRYLSAVSGASSTRPTDDLVACDQRLVSLTDFSLRDEADERTLSVDAGKPTTIEATLELKCRIERLVVEVNVRRALGESVVSLNSGRSDRFYCAGPGSHRIAIHLPSLPLAGGQYFCNVRVWDADQGTTVLDTPYRYPLVVNDGGRATGMFCLEHEWSFCSEPQDKLASETVVEVTSSPTGETHESLPVR